MYDSLREQANALLDRLLRPGRLSPGWDFGAVSASVYDMAWLSMVRKPDVPGGNTAWLFPECFQYVLAEQLPTGGWASYGTPVDDILNTATALLSLRMHLKTDSNHQDWLARSHKAEAALRQILLDWDIHSADSMGSEIIVISLLRLLEQEGIFMNTPHIDSLRAASDNMPRQVSPLKLHRELSTSHHFPQAILDYIRHSRDCHWEKTEESLMGSPASTAAYLIDSTSWDDEAEAYLERVISCAGGLGLKGALSTSPATLFEVVNALKSAGLPININTYNSSDIARYCSLEQNGRLTGVTPDNVLDPYSGEERVSNGDLEDLVQPNGSEGHWTTNTGERNYNFSANCNALIALLASQERDQRLPQIAKSICFLIGEVSKGSGRNKRNLSELHWMMALSRALEALFQDYQIVRKLFDLVVSLQEDIPLVALEILGRILRAQKPNGSWDDICEVTAYGVLALSSLATLPHIQQLGISGIADSITLGKSFLLSNRAKWGEASDLWTGERAESSGALSEAYSISAAFIPLPPSTQSSETASMIPEALISDEILRGMRHAGKLVSRTPLFSVYEPYSLRIAEFKACFFLRILQRQPPAVFPQMGKRIKKSSFIIPLALTACSGLHNYVIDISVLHEMLILSVLNFQVDEYMERVVERHFSSSFPDIRELIQQLFIEVPQEANGGAIGSQKEGKQNEFLNQSKASDPKGPSQGERDAAKEQVSMEDVRTMLHRFVKHILRHPAVLSSPKTLQDHLAWELKTFLLAHVTHAEDNQRLRAQSDSATRVAEAPTQYKEPGRTFYHWVRSTSADHTSCPFAFIFFNCLLHATDSQQTGQGQGHSNSILASARTAYLAEDACRHLASLCRMYNDLGSVARDADECNLNSTRFPEFSPRRDTTAAGGAVAAAQSDAKAELLWIAEYERRGLVAAMEALGNELGPGRTIQSLRFFVDLTDLYGQIYVLEDVGTRIQ
ncbi:hypothetical protein F5Y14DRAFT_418062 [Nemania sp. NC0429]|nr:hypothetical protein F5Y14DRAFT_418062 [Nemania sp. NC0429]